jgi:hypothetical protein
MIKVRKGYSISDGIWGPAPIVLRREGTVRGNPDRPRHEDESQRQPKTGMRKGDVFALTSDRSSVYPEQRPPFLPLYL